MIRNKNGTRKEYIYRTDIRNFMQCSHEKAEDIFLRVKDYEREVLQYESFENRVPQDLFHEYRKKRNRRGN